MKNAAQIGLSFLEFWEITPYEFSLKTNAFIEKLKQEHEDDITFAWLNAYWQRVEKMPSLKKVLGKENKLTDAEEMLQEIKKINASIGGKVVR